MVLVCQSKLNYLQNQLYWQCFEIILRSRQKRLTPSLLTSQAMFKQLQEACCIFSYCSIFFSGNANPLAFQGGFRPTGLCVNQLLCTKEKCFGMCASFQGNWCQDEGRKGSLSRSFWCEHWVSSLAQRKSSAPRSSEQQNTQEGIGK